MSSYIERHVKSAAARLTKPKLVDFAVCEIDREHEEVKSLRESLGKLQEEHGKLKRRAEEAESILSATRAVASLRAARAKAAIECPREQRSLFPDLERDKSSLSGEDAMDPEAVYADLVEKSEAICRALEDGAFFRDALEEVSEDFAHALRILGLDEVEWQHRVRWR